MNNDVDDGQGATLCTRQPQIFSRIRNFNNLAMNSIGYLLSSLGSSTDLESASCENDTWSSKADFESSSTLDGHTQLGSAQHYNDVLPDIRTATTEAPTPTPTRSNSPLRSNRFHDVKRIFTNFALSRQTDSHGRMHSGYPVSNENRSSPLPSETTPSTASPPRSFASDHFATPPLTPDMIDDPLVLSPDPSNGSHQDDMHCDPYRPTVPRNAAEFEPDEDAPYSPSHSLEIKEGKKPERVNVRGIIIPHALPLVTRLLAALRRSYRRHTMFRKITDPSAHPKHRRPRRVVRPRIHPRAQLPRTPALQHGVALSRRTFQGRDSRRTLHIAELTHSVRCRAENHGPRSTKAPCTRTSKTRTIISGRTGIGTSTAGTRGRSISGDSNSSSSHRISRGSTPRSSGRGTSCIGRRYVLHLLPSRLTYSDPGGVWSYRERHC